MLVGDDVRVRRSDEAPSLAGLCSQAVMNEDGVAVLLLVLTTETDDVARAHCAEALARLCEGSQMTMLSVMVQKGLAILLTSLSRDSSPQVLSLVSDIHT